MWSGNASQRAIMSYLIQPRWTMMQSLELLELARAQTLHLNADPGPGRVYQPRVHKQTSPPSPGINPTLTVFDVRSCLGARHTPELASA